MSGNFSTFYAVFCYCMAFSLLPPLKIAAQGKDYFQHMQVWVTEPKKDARLQNMSLASPANSRVDSNFIRVDETITYQTIDGFGFSLTGGSAIVLNRLAPLQREKVLNELFGSKKDEIGISYLRVSVGASDLSDRFFTYNDLPAGAQDTSLSQFSIAPEHKDLIPILKDILAINPQLKIMASPWTAPLWMKTNGKAIGGELKPELYSVYARYLLKYIEAMSNAGIPIDALTIQNEPLHPGNNPSMFMSAAAQNAFIKGFLGPLFKQTKCKTKIVIYDHNMDRIDYPLSILDDATANSYIDGTAFHLYGGSIDAMEYVHTKYPDKHLYFTEQMIDSRQVDLHNDLHWHMKNLIIGATRNWSRVVLQWNLATDEQMGPHTPRPGCDICMGGITIFTNDSIGRNPGYYIIGHASKFVKPGSKRIYSNLNTDLLNVAFLTPGKEKVVIVLNTQNKAVDFEFRYNRQSKRCSLPPGAVGTYVWK